jgi:uncharacterized membrane protein
MALQVAAWKSFPRSAYVLFAVIWSLLTALILRFTVVKASNQAAGPLSS